MTCYPITKDGKRVGVVCVRNEHEIAHRGRTWRFEEASGYAFPHPLRKRDGQPFKRVPMAFWDAYEVWSARRDAYRAGAEAMREACAKHIGYDPRFVKGSRVYLADEIRALPIPEER